MSVHTTGEIAVDVDRTTAFAFLQDPHRLAACIPGCSELHETARGQYSALLTSRVAFMTVSFRTTIEVTKIDSPHAIEATVAGDAVGLPGRVAATAAVSLVDAGARRTIIRFSTDASLTGKLGGLGQPVFYATSARLAREFGENLKRAIEAAATEMPA